MVCLGNMCMDTLHKGDNDDNNNTFNVQLLLLLLLLNIKSICSWRSVIYISKGVGFAD